MYLINILTTVVVTSGWVPHYPERPVTHSPCIICSQTSTLKQMRCLFQWTGQQPPQLSAAVKRENNDMSSDNGCIADELGLLMDL